MDTRQLLQHDFLTPLIDQGRPWVEQYGLGAVCVGLVTETLFLVGYVTPGLAILVAAGYFVGAGVLQPVPTVACAWVSTALGDQLSYAIGRCAGGRLLRHPSGRIRRLHAALVQQGPLLLLWYHYAAPLRPVLPAVAGSARYPYARWIIYDTLGVALWVSVSLGLGVAVQGAVRQQAGCVAQALSVMASALTVYAVWRVGRAVGRAPDVPAVNCSGGPGVTETEQDDAHSGKHDGQSGRAGTSN